MKSTKTFNNISDKLKAQIPKLKPGQVVVVQMLNGTPNPEPDEKERSKTPVLFGRVQIKTNHRIYDPYFKDDEGKETGAYVDIGCVDQWEGDKPARFRFFVPGMGQYSHFQGKFMLTGGNIKDEELYEILYLSPEREGSPCKDEGTEILFKFIDEKAETKTSVSRVARLKEALAIADTMSEKEAREVMAALNQPTYQDAEVLMSKIGELARDSVELFIQTYNNPNKETIGKIRTAVETGVIDYDLVTGEVKMGNVTITNLRTESLDAFVPNFANWIKTSKNGKDVLNNIEVQLNKKNQSVK